MAKCIMVVKGDILHLHETILQPIQKTLSWRVFSFFSSRLPKMVGYPFWAYVALAILTAKCLGTDVAVLS